MNRPNQRTDHLTVEQVASMSDAAVVRRRFARSNVRWAAVVALLALLAAAGQFVTAFFGEGATVYMRVIASMHLVWAVGSAALFGELAATELRGAGRKRRLPVHLSLRNVTPWVMTYVMVEFGFLIFFRSSGSVMWVGWTLAFPWILVFLRLDLPRRVALHIALLAAVVFNVLLIPTDSQSGDYIAAVAVTIVSLALGALASRRLRDQTLDDWQDRRVQAREQLRMRDELQFAREVQLSMVPVVAPSLSWIELAGTSLPATEVGGDYYDYLTSDDAVTIVTGDIAGHGLASGIVLASLRAGFMLLRDSLDQPSLVLRRLSDLVAETSRRRMLATAAVLRIDRRSSRAVIASAGHPPVIFCRDGKARFIELFSPPLGVRLPHEIPSLALDVKSGDVFVLHSDGAYETQNEAGDSFGLDRLASLAATCNLSAPDIRDAIVASLATFRQGTAQSDDVTIVVARVL
ncbi:MAG TPA: SpoIIE family protein phosphatase [Thermoanaerobaculia bacterium]